MFLVGEGENFATVSFMIYHGSHLVWKNGRAFSSQGILLTQEKSGNFTQNTGKIYSGKLK